MVSITKLLGTGWTTVHRTPVSGFDVILQKCHKNVRQYCVIVSHIVYTRQTLPNKVICNTQQIRETLLFINYFHSTT